MSAETVAKSTAATRTRRAEPITNRTATQTAVSY